MYTGYVALLDVLGFTNLIAGENADQRVQAYLDCLKTATTGTDVEFVVFSDSIVLTARDEPDALLDIARACSRLMHDLILEDIPVRGAISKGSILRETVGQNVFIAGRAVVEAYQFEQQQDWIGVMLAPSAVQTAPGLASSLELNKTTYPQLLQRGNVEWAATIQPWPKIPFHGSSAFAGFAVVPNNGRSDPHELRDSLREVIERLDWLRMVAPTPAAQKKYTNAAAFLNKVREHWAEFARQINAEVALKEVMTRLDVLRVPARAEKT